MRKRDLHGAAVASRVIVAGVSAPRRRATYADVVAEPFDTVQVHVGRWWIGP